MPSQPLYLLFAGVNGAGKSTLYRSGLWQRNAPAPEIPRVNPDEIIAARGWNWADPAHQLLAGKEAVRLIRDHLAAGRSFNQETTLSGRSALRVIRDAHERGYRVVMHYVGVESPQIANARIAHRASCGGHFVDPALVERRWEASLANLRQALPLCDEANLFDNTGLLTHVACAQRGTLIESNRDAAAATWHQKVIDSLASKEGTT